MTKTIRTLISIGAVALLVPAARADPGSGPRFPHGWFLGVDSGWAWLLGGVDPVARASQPATTDAWCFGARFGYQTIAGLAVFGRYDRLDVSSPDAVGTLSVASGGVRYSAPTIPSLYAEALVGAAFGGTSPTATVGLGVGASVFVTRHVAFDVAIRDWILDLDGVHHIPTATVGITAGFGG